jgi:ribosomal protein S18 acetylase RimI-like enzyme
LPALEWDGEFTHFRRLFAEAYRYTETGEAVMWIAELREAEIIGQLFVQMESMNTALADGHTRAYIYGFRVRPAYRGAGVGSHLLQTAETDLTHRGFRLICLNVARVNQDARRLYERFGYRVVARRDLVLYR